MRAVNIALAIFLSCNLVCSAQGILPDSIKKGNSFVRFNPLGLIDMFDQNLGFGFEHRFYRRWSGAMDASWIFNSYNSRGSRHTEGIILRPAVRYFYGYKQRRFLEAEFHYKQVNYTIRDWIDRALVNGVASYQEFTKFRYRKEVTGYHLKTGWLIPIRDSRVWMELYTGIGIHSRRVYLVGHPDSRYDLQVDIFEGRLWNDHNVFYVIPTGFRIMYRLD